MKNEINEKMFFIVEKIKYSHSKDTYTIHDNTMYDLTTAVKKLLALDTLNEDRKRTSYHLQEVNFSMVDKPLVLTEEVKQEELEQDEMPF
jgi:hypothetical protein